MAKVIFFGLLGACLLLAGSGRGQTAALLAVSDPAQLAEVQLAKVMADDSSLWLSVSLKGRTRLAVVTAQADTESAPGADAWLRALDYATRVRVAAPPGPLPGCGTLVRFELADSGLPEPKSVVVREISIASSELELRRRLADLGLPADVSGVAEFASVAQPPFELSIYDVPALGGRSEALRLVGRGPAERLPSIVVSGTGTVALSLITLAREGVLPLAGDSAVPSEFPVAYQAVDATSDYLVARAAWLTQNPTRWLNETQASAALFAWTAFPASGQIPSAASRYFGALSDAQAGACDERARAAHVVGSKNAADFVCNGADDLAQSVAQLDSSDPQLSRFFGSIREADGSFRLAACEPRSPLLVATDFVTTGCPPLVTGPASAAPGFTTPPPVETSPVEASPADDPYHDPTPALQAPAPSDEGSCTFSVFDSSSNDSCTGDSTSSDSSGDSCSGDSTPSDASRDSCSGDSSTNDPGPDSCSGDSSDSSSDSCSGNGDSSRDSAGCGKSEYDGDTCSGNAASGNAQSSTAALLSGKRSATRPRQVRLSLLTLLAAALSLPLRRMRASR